MLDEDEVVKICDFGISRIEHFGDNSTTTPTYSSSHKIFMPPEILPPAAPSRPTHVTDVFSCGMLFLSLAVDIPGTAVGTSMLSGVAALKGIWSQDVTSVKVRRPQRWTRLSGKAADELWVLIQTMTEFDPSKRGSMDLVQMRLAEIFEGVIS